MEGLKIFCALLIAYPVMEVTSMTLREALQEHLRDGPKPASWNFDVAMGTLINAPRDVVMIPASSLTMLQDVFRFVPDANPTINQILKGQHPDGSVVIQKLLESPIDDVIEIIGDIKNIIYPNRCPKSANATCHDHNVHDVTTVPSDVTTQHPYYDECMADLIPMVIPPTKWLLVYIKNLVNRVRKSAELKGFKNMVCRIGLQTTEGKVQDFIDTLPDVTQFPSWGVDIVDAIAKPPTAILGGQLQWVGGYEMCNQIKVSYTPEGQAPNITRAFDGKYCRIMLGQRPKWDNTMNATVEGFPLSLGFGVCLPNTCTTEGLLEHLTGTGSTVDSVLKIIGFEVKSVFCGNDMDFETDGRAKLAFGIIMLLIVLVACATVYDLIIRPATINKWTPDIPESDTGIDQSNGTVVNSLYPSLQIDFNGNPISAGNGQMSCNGKGHAAFLRQSSIASTRSLISSTSGSITGPKELYEAPGFLDRIEAAFTGFSASVSMRKMFDVTNLSPSHMASLDGIRFLSVVYAIFGNTFLFGIVHTEIITVSNLVHKLLEMPHQLLFQPVLNYSFSSDSFLVVSGTVVSYHWLRRLRKAGGRLTLGQLVHFYLHRYWSLMPVMMLVLMVYTCLYKYLLSGPMSPPEITDAENCRTNWWVNLLMLSNLVKTETACLAWTWYIPLLFQLHIITPIILIPLSYKRWAGWISLSVMYLIFISAVSGVVKNHIYGDIGAWYPDYLLTPWCRAGPYFIGVAVGIILHEQYIHRIPKNMITKIISSALMVLSVFIVLMLMFITYTKYRKDNPVKWTEDQTVSFHTFSRSAWGLAIGYMILASETGFGGVVKPLISHSCMTPPSRVAYSVFVAHAIFIFRYAYVQFDTIYITFSNLMYIFFGHLIYTYLIGMIIALLFFTPFQGLEFAFFGAKTKLDIITAGTCQQVFRDLNLWRDEPKARGKEEDTAVTAM